MTTRQQPVRRRPSARLVVPVALGVVLVAIWAFGIVGWPGRVFDGAWQLRSAEVDGQALSLSGSRPLGLVMDTDADQDTVDIQAPCNYYAAKVSGAQDIVPDGSTDLAFVVTRGTLAGCAGPEQTRLEERYVAAYARVDHAEREGDALTLTGPGVRLVFDRAAPGVLVS